MLGACCFLCGWFLGSCWVIAGWLLGVCWVVAGCLLGVCCVLAACVLGDCWVLAPAPAPATLALSLPLPLPLLPLSCPCGFPRCARKRFAPFVSQRVTLLACCAPCSKLRSVGKWHQAESVLHLMQLELHAQDARRNSRTKQSLYCWTRMPKMRAETLRTVCAPSSKLECRRSTELRKVCMHPMLLESHAQDARGNASHRPRSTTSLGCGTRCRGTWCRGSHAGQIW